MRIIFMGTPAFAVPTLIKLHESGFTIPAVITATDKLGGRGKKNYYNLLLKRQRINLIFQLFNPLI